jgi:hypothetical protein
LSGFICRAGGGTRSLHVHVAHAAAGRHAGRSGEIAVFLFRNIGDEAFGSEDHTGDRGGILESGDGDFGRVNNPILEEGAEFVGKGVIAVVGILTLDDFVEDETVVSAGVFGDSSEGLLEGVFENFQADFFFFRIGLDLIEDVADTEEGDTAAGNNPIGDSGFGSFDSILNPFLFFFEFDFGSSADVDDGDSAGEFGQSLLEFFFVKVGGSGFDFSFKLFDAGLNLGGVTLAADDAAIVFVGPDFVSLAAVVDGDGVKLAADVFRDDGTAGENGKVGEHGLATVAEAGGFDSEDVEGAAEFVDYQGGEGFAFDFVGNDDEVLGDLDEVFQERKKIRDGGDFFIGNEDVGGVDFGFHAIGVGDEVGGDKTLVEFHTFFIFDFQLKTFGFFDGDNAVITNFFEGFGNFSANFGIGGGDGGDLGLFFFVFNGFGELFNFGDNGVGAFVNAFFEDHGVGSGGDVFSSLGGNSVGEDSGSSSAITGDVVGLTGSFFDELSAHVFKRVFEFDFLGDGDTVVDNGGGAPLALHGDVAAARTEGGSYRLGKEVNALEEFLAGVFAEFELFSHRQN